MLFPTIEYALFFLIVAAAAWALHARLFAHKLVLLVASLVFYGFWDLRFVPLLLGISLLSFLVARLIQREERRPVLCKIALISGVTISLGALAFFKYLAFLSGLVAEVLHLVGITWLPKLSGVALPMGISFFVFHAISLMVDAYLDKIPVRIRLVDSLLYVSFFPQLVAGPILRASSFLPELQRARDPRSIDVSRALTLIASGLFKKVLIASSLASSLVDPVFEVPAGRSGLEVLLALYGYSAQIYCDFSGYTDLALGSALLLGYELPPNVDAPYSAGNPSDFWRRWHMSLSSWLRDYVFFPLSFSRFGEGRWRSNVMITMLLAGLWHGPAFHFVLWGALHGAAQILHRSFSVTRAAARLARHPAWGVVATVLTFHFVTFCAVFFRAPSVGRSLEVFRALLAPWVLGPWLKASLVAGILLAVVGPGLGRGLRASLRQWTARLPIPVQGALFGLAVVAIDALGPRGIAPFIYFRF